MKKRSMLWVAAICLTLILLPVNAFAEEIPTFDTIRQAGEYVREGLIHDSFEMDENNRIEVWFYLPASVADSFGELFDQLNTVIQEHTGDPKGGDYLKANYICGYGGSLSGDYWTVHYFIDSFQTKAQNAAVDTAVADLLAELQLDGKSDYEKVRAIYDWMCSNVEYDKSKVNRSTYTALVERKTVCQGYCSLFYRLCLEVGVDCRTMEGYTIGYMGTTTDAHGWSAVRIDGQYYLVDTTWGADWGANKGAEWEDGKFEYYWFLKGEGNLPGHYLSSESWTADVESYCQIAAEDYPIPERSTIVESASCGSNASYTMDATGVVRVTGTGIMKKYPNVIFVNSDVVLPRAAGEAVEVVIEEGITSIAPEAYLGSSLWALHLPESLVSIDDGADVGPNLLSLHIPQNLTNIPVSFTRNLRYMCTITVEPENPAYTVINNSLYTKDGKTLLVHGGVIDADGRAITEYAVAEGTETIASYAFFNRNMLNKVTLPDSVKYIEDYAFKSSNNCRTELTDSIVSIGAHAFEGCGYMADVYIGKNVSYIGEAAFVGHQNANITVHPENPYFICQDGVLFNKDMTRLIRYPVARQDTVYVIPDGVTEIGASAFEGFASSIIDSANLEEVIFPDSVLTIGEGAFREQVNLKVLELPSRLQRIESSAFYSVGRDLETIRIPDSVTYIGDNAFGYRYAKEIVIGSGVEYVGYGAFTESALQTREGITSVTFRGAPPKVTGEYAINDILFGRYPEAMDRTVVYYPLEYAAEWAPAGETKWKPTKLELPEYVIERHEKESYPIYAYHESTDGRLHSCMADTTKYGWSKYTCQLCGAEWDIIFADYPVTRIYGADRYETAFRTAEVLKKQLGVEKFDNIVVACGDNFADALGGSYLAAKKGAPILLVKSDKIDAVKSYIKANLNPGGTVYLLGGTAAIPAAMDKGLGGFHVKRLAGANRYDTNLLILEEAGVTNEKILVCTGTNFADSLSAAATGLPILLVKDSLSDSQKTFLQSTFNNYKYVLGGTAAVSVQLLWELNYYYGSASRIGGDTRYETSVLIAEKFFPDADQAVLAYAQNFPDGLSGGALAYTMDAPLVLTASGKEAAAASYAREKNITSGVILGGPGLISDKAVRTIFQMKSGDGIKIE